MIFGNWIGRWGEAFPDKEALVDAITGARLTYRVLAAETYRMAHLLRNRLQVGKGDRVACLSFNRREIITLFLATSRLGAILAPLNFRLAPEEFGYYLEDASPKVFFFDLDHLEAVERIREGFPLRHWVCLDQGAPWGIALPDLWPSLPQEPPSPVELGPEDPQLIIYTSGTTGLPKGVVLTHGMITWNALNTILGWDLGARDRTILHAALFYTAGWNVFTLPLILCRGVNILVRSFDANLILELMERERVTVFFGVPTMYRMMLDSPRFARVDLSGLRFAVSGGAPLGREIFQAFKERKGIHIWEGYGLTEVGPNNFLANGKPGSLGHPMPFVEARVADDQGRPVPKGAEGELLLRGPHMCAGYWNKPEATAEAIREGWFHTGDLALVDVDDHYRIVGRKKDMIISGGANIYPAEIERAIEAHPDVVAAAVIGVPDPKWGEVGKAVVELHQGARLTLEELTRFLEGRLGRFKLPKYLAVVKELPRTPASGKIQKFLLRKQYGKAQND